MTDDEIGNGRGEPAIIFPAGSVHPEGREVTTVILRGTGTQIVDWTMPEFARRFSEFMDAEHARGDLFEFPTFYSWKAEVNKLHQLHVIHSRGAWTVDGCQDVQAFEVGYMSTTPIDLPRHRGGGEIEVVGAGTVPFPVHGPGKRR